MFTCRAVYLLATSRCNVIWETTRRIQRQLVTETYYGEVANLLRTCYGETGVMDFGLDAAKFSSIAIWLR